MSENGQLFQFESHTRFKSVRHRSMNVMSNLPMRNKGLLTVIEIALKSDRGHRRGKLFQLVLRILGRCRRYVYSILNAVFQAVISAGVLALERANAT